ncbi:synaptonemal complex protein 3 [Nematostella vectensis]|uniref:synaptonemal complex protein 3 n=1 Tax=Nematostella vectensis TaxID=45351 RepID=UPI002076F9DA|nr:synaptonemal complex protein 3 [Nematostella vectensis]XP_048585534.1 synaptonemal complex protein 3 [Nematostella vectensis]XP_048585535.1 synaptonemal complex protein 3 [Nematostella vectensis]
MPLNPKRNKPAAKSSKLDTSGFDEFDDDLMIGEQETAPVQVKATVEQPKRSRKRTVIEQTPDENFYDDQDEEETPAKGTELEMSTLLNGFGAEISNTLNAKRKRIQSFSQASLKASSRKFDEVWRKQQNERSAQYEEFSKQVLLVLGQWEADLQKTREVEEKLESMYKQQQKLFNQQRIVQTQRLKRVQQLHEDYGKSLKELRKTHEDQQSSVQEQLRKEISGLQKKILSDTQQQDLTNVRRSLQAMLAQV